jgi:hypothetical protein
MHYTRTIQQVDEMIELARLYCSRLAAYRSARSTGALSEREDCATIMELARIDARIELLKRCDTQPLRPRRTSRSAVRLRRIFRRLTR